MGLNPTARDLRRINKRTILQTMFQSDSISRLELSQRSGLSTGTVTNIINELLTEGIVLESGFAESEGGRRRSILTLNQTYRYFLGGELGETDIMIELFDLRLQKLNAFRISLTPEQNNPSQVVRFLIDGITILLQAAELTPDKILSMGLGLPGIVEYTEREMVSAPAWNWEPIPLKAMLREHFPFAFHLDNGVKVMALGEVESNPLMATKTVASVTLGTGVGAGIIHEGKLYRGATNSAGEWGHTIFNLDGPLCRCGRRGCLEAYIGSAAIIHRLRERADQHPALSCPDEISIIQALIRAARQDDAVANQVLEETLHYLGAGLANLINLFNPHCIILGGWLSGELGTFALPAIEEIVARYALTQPNEVVEISLSLLGRDGVSMGAARLCLEEFLDNVGGGKNSASLTSLQR
ncbi:ROK family transcriptional regulator [Dictyobacter kobayashii]|uniref:Sugar kinase n=1 Tax=Dictyobacter kobayashii TaxID=2014872 RepID=A0A402ARE4_9CHLR|nr:ROK family transcriptional regulator [Dictyobacter kobayashii]GCE21643.1 sugar kinase [Dictyobacter kobayashii]